MRRVWSGENRTQRYLDIEAALARAQASLGVIPAEAAVQSIGLPCRLDFSGKPIGIASSEGMQRAHLRRRSVQAHEP